MKTPDEQRQARGDEDRPRNVEALTVLVEALREQERRQNQRGNSNRDVDPEDPLPREEVGEDAAEEHTGCRPEPADRPPRAERDVPLTAFLEGPHEDGQRSRSDRRSAEPLKRSESDQRLVIPCEATEE
jgi:hypothetical protein